MENCAEQLLSQTPYIMGAFALFVGSELVGASKLKSNGVISLIVSVIRSITYPFLKKK